MLMVLHPLAFLSAATITFVSSIASKVRPPEFLPSLSGRLYDGGQEPLESPIVGQISRLDDDVQDKAPDPPHRRCELASEPALRYVD